MNELDSIKKLIVIANYKFFKSIVFKILVWLKNQRVVMSQRKGKEGKKIVLNS